jgi:hypothetical protein
MIMDQIDALVSDASKVVQGASDMKSAVGQYGQEQYNKGWDEAMAQAGSSGSTDKIYSEAEMNAIIAQTQAPLNDVIAQKQSIIDGIEGQVANAKAEALAAYKAELKVKLLEAQAAENAAESSFASLLD